MAGIPVTLLLGWLAFIVPQSINAPMFAEAKRAQSTDVSLEHAITLPAVIAVLSPVKDGGNQCLDLCQRLLYRNAASRIIVGDSSKTNNEENSYVEYKIERGTGCKKQGWNRDDIPIATIAFPGDNARETEMLVRQQISDGNCLIASKGSIGSALLTISYEVISPPESYFKRPWTLFRNDVGINRLEVTAPNHVVLFRRTELLFATVVRPLHIDIASGFLTTMTYVGWARRDVELGKLGPIGRDVLPDIFATDALKPKAKVVKR